VIKHIVCFSFKPEVSAAEVDATLAALNALPGQIPWVKNWSLGKNLSDRERTYTHALCCDFADMDELNNYLRHPAHDQLAREKLVPQWSQRVIMDYEC
jgi:2,3-dihydroxy-p-cumate/2,3-dihydroxybenzoate 3,4-dioxygenase